MSSRESSEIFNESAKSEGDPTPAENEPEEEQDQEQEQEQEEPGDDGEHADDGSRREPVVDDGGKEPDDRPKQQLEGVAGDQRKEETLRADEELLFSKDAPQNDARQSSFVLRKCAAAGAGGGCYADAKEDQAEVDAEADSPTHDVTAATTLGNTDEKQGGGGEGGGGQGGRRGGGGGEGGGREGGGRGGGGHESTRTKEDAEEEEDERKRDGADTDAPCKKDGIKIKSEEKKTSEDGEGKGGGGKGEGEVGVEVGAGGGVKRGDATITKKYLKAAGALESNSHPASSSTIVVTPKKPAQKVNSIIEGYVTKVSGGGADRVSPQGKRAVRRSETDSSSSSSKRGNISEIRERIERSASSAAAAQSPRKAGGKEDEEAGTSDGSALEERRRKKAEEWMNKITKGTKSSVDNGVQHSPASVNQTALTSATGKGNTSSSAWKRKEEELKREKEQREAAQKQLEEKRKKLEEERRLARESSKKRNDLDRTDSAKKDLTLHGQKSTTTATRTTKATTTTTTTTTPETKNSSHSTRLLSSANEDEEKMKKKQKALESRVQPLNIEGLDAEGLEKMVNEMHKRIIILEEEKYDLETLLEKRENELHEIKVRMGESKGKFVKPPLKKVIKREEV